MSSNAFNEQHGQQSPGQGEISVAVLETPMKQVVVASLITMSTLGLVLSGSWLISSILS